MANIRCGTVDSSFERRTILLRGGLRSVYRDTTQISHEKKNLNKRWPTIGESTHDSSSHASSNVDVADDWCLFFKRGANDLCIENNGTNLNKRWPQLQGDRRASHPSCSSHPQNQPCQIREGLKSWVKRKSDV